MKIIATGSALPHLELTNYDISKYVDTSDEWIYTRTGIKSRRVISTETITGLAVNAAKNCIESSGVSPDEIDYYVQKYRPLDKAGAYGVQEWIGYVGVTRMEGSYFNVMGFPICHVYERLKKYLR